MTIIIKQLQLISRIDQFIRLQATGSPEEFAAKLGISRTKLYRTIAIMKELEAPLVFDGSSQSYRYLEDIGFSYGFYKNTPDLEKKTIPIQQKKAKKSNFFSPVSENDTAIPYYCIGKSNP